MNKTIRMAFHRPEIARTVDLDKWSFAPVKKWAWLHRAAWWFLGKTGALSNTVSEKISYKEIVIDKDSVSETILRAMDEMSIMNVRPSSVLMGPEHFDKALYEMRDTYSFTIEMGYHRKIYGLPVTIVPWMRGVVVMP